MRYFGETWLRNQELERVRSTKPGLPPLPKPTLTVTRPPQKPPSDLMETWAKYPWCSAMIEWKFHSRNFVDLPELDAATCDAALANLPSVRHGVLDIYVKKWAEEKEEEARRLFLNLTVTTRAESATPDEVLVWWRDTYPGEMLFHYGWEKRESATAVRNPIWLVPDERAAVALKIVFG
jgi:hypothetical protein